MARKRFSEHAAMVDRGFYGPESDKRAGDRPRCWLSSPRFQCVVRWSALCARYP